MAESAGVQAIRDRLKEANEDIERLTINAYELYQANLAQVQRLFIQRRGVESNARVLEGHNDTVAYNKMGNAYLHHALNALTALIDTRRLSNAASTRKKCGGGGVQSGK